MFACHIRGPTPQVDDRFTVNRYGTRCPEIALGKVFLERRADRLESLVTGPMDICHVGKPDRGGFGPQTSLTSNLHSEEDRYRQ
jgi:hypothetical protein